MDARARSLDVKASPLVTSHAALTQSLLATAVDYRQSSRIKEEPVHVEHSRAITLDKSLAQAEAERAALADRADRLVNRLKIAEEEREKWMVEAQLRQSRYEKLLQRMTSGNQTSGVPSSTSLMNFNTAQQVPQRNREDSTIDGKTGENKSPNGDDGNEEKKNAILELDFLTKHFAKRFALLSQNAREADAEASYWKAECRSLTARLAQIKLMSNRLAEMQSKLLDRDDELDTVRNSYESQLQAMAEHLASLNERIIKQADESEVLQRQLRLQQQNASSSSNSSSSKHGSRRLLGKHS